jgi:iron complex outermembrane receptor protein
MTLVISHINPGDPMIHKTQVCKGLMLAFGGSIAFSASSVLAQQSQDQQQQQQQPQQLMRVEVTGSSIKRIEGETALPVQVITRRDIERTGATTVEQLLQTVTAASSSGGLTASSMSGATTGGISAVGLRGLSSLRTLVLINGRRIAPYGIGFTNDSVSVDVNSIPLNAVERVEVLKDGASAVYGSDAIAGVINFILRKDLQGGDISAQYGDSTKGGAAFKKISGAWGMGDLTADRYNLMFVANYQKEDPLFGRQRSFADHAANVDHLNDTSSSASFPANFFTLTPGAGNPIPVVNPTAIGPDVKANPGAPACPGPWSYSDPLSGGDRAGLTCHFNPSPFVQLVPSAERISLFASGRFAITSDIEAYVEASYNRNKQDNIIQPSPLGFAYGIPPNNPLANQYPYNQGYQTPYASTINITSSSPYYPTAYVQSITGGATPDLTILYRDVANGLRHLTDTATAPRLTFGVKGTAAGWDFDANFLHSESKVVETDATGFPILSKILPILNSGNFNFWGPNTDAVNAQVAATNYVGEAYRVKSSLDSVQARGSRELMKLPAGALALAIGVEARKEKYNFQSSAPLAAGDLAGYGGSIASVDRSRNVEAAFGELSIPILKTLEADLAVRYDHYAGVGSSTTPKASLRYQPMRELLIRGAIGRGFRAPSLADLYTPITTGVTTPGLNDPLRCPTTNNTPIDCQTQFNITNGGTSTLKPEKATSATLGFVAEPTSNVSIAVDAFKIDLTNTISNGFPASFILSSPALATQYGYLITRNAASGGLPGSIANIDQTNVNLGGTKLSGFDFDFKLGVPSSIGKFTLSYTGTYFMKFDTQNPDGSWTHGVDQANTVNGGTTPRLKTYLMLNLTQGPWSYTLAQNWQTGYTDAPGSVQNAQYPDGKPNQTSNLETYDGMIQYAGFKDLKLTLGVRDLLNRKPPYANSPASFQTGYDPQVSDPRGRFVYGVVNYSFR